MKKKIKVTVANKKRALGTLFLAVFLFTLAFFILEPSTVVDGKQEPQYVRYVVREGDTLWAIASRYQSKKDIREKIYEINQVNQRESANLSVGEILQIPLN